MNRQIALDTETTGLDASKGHRIIEIGCVEIIDRQITGKNWHFYLNPDRQIDAGAVAVHGITEAFLKDKPRFNEIADSFLDFIRGAQLVIHNAAFDLSFLDSEMSLLNRGIKKINTLCEVIDTLMLGRQKHPGQKNNLDALCKRYSVDISARELHGALLDAQLLAMLYLAMTGGQGTLFGEHQSNSNNGATRKTTQQKLQGSHLDRLIVLKAPEDEIQEHNKHMSKIKNALWETQE